MELIWDQSASLIFQNQLTTNLSVWKQALSLWRMRIESASNHLGTDLTGEAAQAIKTLFVTRILPIVESGRSLCSWTTQHLDIYARAEAQLEEDGDVYLAENYLQNTIDLFEQEITDLITIDGLDRHDQAVLDLVETKLSFQKKLDGLRGFEIRVRGIFDEDTSTAFRLCSAIESIQNGTLVGGVYQPAPGDDESWMATLSDYLESHPIAATPDAVADLMEKKLRENNLLEGDITGTWYEQWLKDAAAHDVPVDEILRIAKEFGITPDDFSILNGLQMEQDPDGKYFFILPDSINSKDVQKAVLMTYILNAGTDYATADDSLAINDPKHPKDSCAETPYSVAEIQRVIDRQKLNAWSYSLIVDYLEATRNYYPGISNSGAWATTPNGTLMGIGGNTVQDWFSQSEGTTYGDVFILNYDNLPDPESTLVNVITNGKVPSLSDPTAANPGTNALDLDRMLHHEELHSQQWAATQQTLQQLNYHGIPLVPLPVLPFFGAEYGMEYQASGKDGSKNYFEIGAGLADGGYV